MLDGGADGLGAGVQAVTGVGVRRFVGVVVERGQGDGRAGGSPAADPPADDPPADDPAAGAAVLDELQAAAVMTRAAVTLAR